MGEKEGKEVRDLSEAAMDDAELEGCDTNFLGFDLVRVECPLLLLVEAFETWEVVRCKGDEASVDASGSIITREESSTTSHYPFLLFV